MRYLLVVRNLLLAAACLALLVGCSISYSSGKSSDSSVSSFSSGGNDSKKADKEISTYVNDVIAATNQYVSHGGSGDEFQHQISYIAGKHNIVDWANQDSTYIAMGKGLKGAGISEEKILTLPYFSTLSQSDKYKLVLQGFKE